MMFNDILKQHSKYSPLFLKCLCINSFYARKAQVHQGKHLLNLAASSFSQTVIICNKRLDLTASIITHYKFYIECVFSP